MQKKRDQIASVVSGQPKKRDDEYAKLSTKEREKWGCYNEYAPYCKRKEMMMNMLQIASVVSWQPKKGESGVVIMNMLQIAKEKGAYCKRCKRATKEEG